MKTLLYISRRFSKGKKRGSLLSTASIVSVASVAVGTLAVIVSMAILAGFEDTFERAASQMNAHITVRTHNGAVSKNARDLQNEIANVVGVEHVHANLHVDALIEIGERTAGVRITGIDSTRYVRGGLATNIQTATRIPPYSLVLGRPLAAAHSIKRSDDVVVLAMDSHSSPVIDLCAVHDIYSTGFSSQDKLQAFADIEYVRELASLPLDAAHSFSVYVDATANVDSLSWQIQRALGYPWLAMTAVEENAAVFAWIDLQKEPIPIVLGLLCLVAAGTIAASMFILVLEKVSSIGTLRSFGVSQAQIRWLFLLQGLSFGLLGNAIGVGMAFSFSVLQQQFKLISLDASVYYLDALPVTIDPLHYIVAVFASLLVCGSMSLLPAFAGARIDIVESLRFK